MYESFMIEFYGILSLGEIQTFEMEIFWKTSALMVIRS